MQLNFKFKQYSVINFVQGAVLYGVALVVPLTAQACSSCGCTLSSEWESQGLSSASGLKLDLRYDYLNQSQLRSGSGKVNRANYPIGAAGREIEIGTINRYTTLGIDYAPNADWGINVQIPYIDRSHSTYGEDAADATESSASHTRSLGDMKVIGRYQGFAERKNFGVQVGMKLPTGSHGRNFNAGLSAGKLLDRGLQPGSDSTDLLLGLYHFDALSQNCDYFAQGMVQTPVATQDGFRPGTSLNLNLGLRYMALGNIQPQLQINARTVAHDSGAQADRPNSGGNLAYFSPGVTVGVTRQTKLYGFVQLPIYQYVNGFQLAPRWTASVGANFSF